MVDDKRNADRKCLGRLAVTINCSSIKISVLKLSKYYGEEYYCGPLAIRYQETYLLLHCLICSTKYATT